MNQQPLEGIKVCVFDAYGTLFDYASAAAQCQDVLGSKLDGLNALWREKQLQYTWLRTLPGKHADFWTVTRDALDFSLEMAGVASPALREKLMALYLILDPFPEVLGPLRRLRLVGVKTAILSNGTPEMLRRAVENAKIGPLLDAVLSVQEVGVYKPPRESISLRWTGWAPPARRFYFFRLTPGMPMRPRHSACAWFGVTDIARSQSVFPVSLTALCNRYRNCPHWWGRFSAKGALLMNRRKFIASTGAAAGVLRSGCMPAATTSHQPLLLKLGCQSAPTNDTHLQYLARYGVRNICGYPEIGEGRLYATVDELRRLRDLGEKYGISIDCIAPPFLESTHVDKTPHPAIMLASSPERDRDIEAVQTLIRNCAAAGIPSIKYNMSLLGVLRTQSTPGRGDAMYSTWRLRDAHPDPPLTRAGRVDADMFWERITYFLERVIPVADEYKIRMACHPHDPGVPPEGYQGVVRVLGTVDGLKRFITIKESPYHGLNFCQGTVSEMLNEPGQEIYEVIRYFGSRKKIFNVHFRNIRGRRDDFQEVYPDEGDIDFVKALLVYKEVGYPFMLMPDHVPVALNDPGGLQSFAFCYGYIRALLQAVDHMA